MPGEIDRAHNVDLKVKTNPFLHSNLIASAIFEVNIVASKPPPYYYARDDCANRRVSSTSGI